MKENIKTFTINWNDYGAVSKLGNQIKSRLGEINPNKKSRNEFTRHQLDACLLIYNTDISEIYENMELDSSPIYYVYAHLNPSRKIAIGRDGKTSFAATLGMEYFPFYVGKGTGARYKNVNRNETHRKIKERLAKFDQKVIAYKIKDNLTEKEALGLESKLIDIFGLVPHRGLLTNLDEGILPDVRRLLYPSGKLESISTLQKGVTNYLRKD